MDRQERKKMDGMKREEKAKKWDKGTEKIR